VAEVDPDLVVRDKNGETYMVRYDAVNAMLLNEFLKEYRKNEQQESKLEEQEPKIARQEQQIEALIAGLQKVSAQLELAAVRPENKARLLIGSIVVQIVMKSRIIFSSIE
jgi:predicted ribosome quality control (RQC) complex YloA/Tae2 family protein